MNEFFEEKGREQTNDFCLNRLIQSMTVKKALIEGHDSDVALGVISQSRMSTPLWPLTINEKLAIQLLLELEYDDTIEIGPGGIIINQETNYDDEIT